MWRYRNGVLTYCKPLKKRRANGRRMTREDRMLLYCRLAIQELAERFYRRERRLWPISPPPRPPRIPRRR